MSCGPTPSRSLLLLLLLLFLFSFSYTCFLFFFSSSALQLIPATRALLFLHQRHRPPFVLYVTRLFSQPLYSIHSEIRLDPLGARHYWTSHLLSSVSFIPFAFLFLGIFAYFGPCLPRLPPPSKGTARRLLASPSRRLRHTSTLSRAREPTQFTARP